MDRYNTHNMVEYIKTQPEFPFDAIDVEESLDNVLCYFGLHPKLDEQERHEITRDLLKLALSGELAEMQRIVDLGLMSGIDHVRNTRLPRQRPSISPAQFMEELHLA
ncbi:hypothetical protein PDESU_02247 [Pontiella desulfatans]|uniref:Uncharacterized protein n=1 Tax=Pontiella desulfatans TaxID=2750659 RepID=A0A6C2U142_PONDE|nr:hypothetical protein [Pontiella desulfatans]VGO13690.1 hypothetical protein PDESU_02247 [Pontiella desulfatans]